MKLLKLFFTTALLFQTLTSFSQTEQEMEAIAKYQLAEEAYSNNEFDKALKYLEQSKEIIGNRPKLIYLQITIQLDKGYNSVAEINKILNTIDAFEKSPGIDTFSPEKKMIVAKNKVLIKEKLDSKIAEEENLKKQKADQEIKSKEGKKNFDNFTIDDLPLGLSLEEFLKQFPNVLPENYKMEKSKWPSTSEADIIYVCHAKNVNFENKDNFILPYNASTGVPLYDTKIHAIFVKNGKVVGLQKNIYYYNSKGDLTYQGAVSEMNKQLDSYKRFFESKEIPLQNYSDQWDWVVAGDKGVHLFIDNYVDPKNPNRWKNSLTIRVYKEFK